jgi:hypothetical protein
MLSRWCSASFRHGQFRAARDGREVVDRYRPCGGHVRGVGVVVRVHGSKGGVMNVDEQVAVGLFATAVLVVFGMVAVAVMGALGAM